MRISDWSSDVCSSDLALLAGDERSGDGARRAADACLHAGCDFGAQGSEPCGPIAGRGSGDDRRGEGITDATEALEPDLTRIIKAARLNGFGRSEERRVGKECVSTGRYRWTARH